LIEFAAMDDLPVSFPKPCSERWEDMRPRGCNRFCDRCEKTIRDLSQLTIDDAERLARSGDKICVRAHVGPDGLVRLKPNDGRHARRMVATIGASVGILAVSGQAAAADATKAGAIKGQTIASCGWDGSVSATAADGSVFHAKIGMNGRYKIKRLPAGSYEVKIESAAPQAPLEENAGPEAPAGTTTSSQVTVEAGHTSVLNLSNPNGCIVIGMLQIEGGERDSDG
jgi:hypothetical protein